MKKIVACLLIGFGWVSFACAVGNPVVGQEKIATCVACHGADGNSMVNSFPKLAGQNARYLIKQLQDMRSGERVIVEMMGMLDHLNDQDLADIAAYFASQQATMGAADLELAEVGEMMYRAGNAAKGIPACAACHSPTGAGNTQAGFPALAGQHPDYIAKQLYDFRTKKRHNDDGKMMRQVVELMNDKEIDAVASYIQGLSD
jgi:cytochrome c553